jgi:cytochrome b561
MYKSSLDSWGLVAKIFHWLVALLIIWQLFTGFNLSNLEFSPQKIVFIGIHKIFGTIIFLLIIMRLGWRLYNTPPSNSNLPKLHRIVSTIVHNFLYLLVILTTVQGTLMSQVGGFDVKLLGLITIPRLITENLDIYPVFKSLHYTFWMLLLATFIIHLIGGLYHRFSGDKHKVWKRMSFWPKKNNF